VCPEDGRAPRGTLPGPPLLDGAYRLDRRLGEGGMGVVYRARHLALGRDVAVKLVRPSVAPEPAYLARFRNEAAALGRLEHPAIVNVTDFGIDPRADGVPYLVMQLLAGESLDDHLRRSGPLSIDQALPILEAVAAAVDYAHERGVLHRDLKPSNVLLARAADGALQAKLLDFGLARLAGSRPSAVESEPPAVPPAGSEPLDDRTPVPTDEAGRTLTVAPRDASAGVTVPGQILGTPRFMAPELFSRAESSPATDIYALGVMAVLVLTGHTPFFGSLHTVVRAHLEETPPRPSTLRAGLSAALDGALLQALAKDPAERPRTAQDFVRRLRAAEAAERLRLWRARERPRRGAIALAGGLCLALGAAPLGALAPLAALERSALDARLALSAPRPGDPRLALVLLDEASLAAESRALGDMAEPVAAGLERIFDAVAAAVAVDLIVPEAWGRSGPFARFVVAHADRLALAAMATPDGIVGAEAARGVTMAALGEASAARLFGLANLEEDPDGVVRRGRLGFETSDGGRFDTWAAAAAKRFAVPVPAAPPASKLFPGAPPGTFFIDFRAVAPRAVAWRELAGALAREPRLFEGRLVVFGAQLAGSGDDALRVPSGAVVSGPQLQALMIQTILGGFPLRDAPAAGVLGALGLALAAASFVALFGAGVLRPLLVSVGLAVAWLVGSAAAFRLAGLLVPVAGPLAALAVASALALLLRRKLPRRPPSPAKASKA
jgi:serine/threonine-protein kinase